MSSYLLRDDLFALFACSPYTFVSTVLGERNPSDDLMASVSDYIDRHRKMLMLAKHFVVDSDAELLLSKLLQEMKDEGLEDTFRTVRFPFPYVLLESNRDLGGRAACLLVEGDDGFYSECFVGFQDGIAPNSSVLLWEGRHAQVLSSPLDYGRHENSQAQKDQELRLNSEFSGMFVALATLLSYEGMLVAEERPLYSRADRRRAARVGEILPDARKIVVNLGSLGKGQLAAMVGASDEINKAQKRAHWVRGHFMRNRSGGLSWRNPHIRGAGPLIHQQRRVTAD